MEEIDNEILKQKEKEEVHVEQKEVPVVKRTTTLAPKPLDMDNKKLFKIAAIIIAILVAVILILILVVNLLSKKLKKVMNNHAEAEDLKQRNNDLSEDIKQKQYEMFQNPLRSQMQQINLEDLSQMEEKKPKVQEPPPPPPKPKIKDRIQEIQDKVQQQNQLPQMNQQEIDKNTVVNEMIQEYNNKVNETKPRNAQQEWLQNLE